MSKHIEFTTHRVDPIVSNKIHNDVPMSTHPVTAHVFLVLDTVQWCGCMALMCVGGTDQSLHFALNISINIKLLGNCLLNMHSSQIGWPTPAIPALKKLRQGNLSLDQPKLHGKILSLKFICMSRKWWCTL